MNNSCFKQVKFVCRVTALRHLPVQHFPAQDEKGAYREATKLKGRTGVLENWLAREISLTFIPSVSESVPSTWAWEVLIVNQMHLFMGKNPRPSSFPSPPISFVMSCLHPDVKWGGMYENKGITSWVISIMLLSISSQFLGVHYCIISFVPMLFHQGQCWFTQLYQWFLLRWPRQYFVIYIMWFFESALQMYSKNFAAPQTNPIVHHLWWCLISRKQIKRWFLSTYKKIAWLNTILQGA